ncbi:transcription cofactor HES-6 isoform X1 [Phyllostomus hastatus]|uniref:transcription cofactor HES-6 isoform X1 n=1 Tax=Phyllostomus hastatus TaxID=9423 RepID=UPI001E680D3F|nr:transcription cofactor HES-6 isoform X1 [Phyllostomus hastatus]
MAPSPASGAGGWDRAGRENDGGWETRVDRKARKPLVEKKRRARINESLQELRLLLAGTEVQAKLENAEVLELTVRRVQGALRGWARGLEQLQAEASERFAAGYIQCMHEVHTFVSTCQAIDATVAAELLNHLLESMPLHEGSSFRDLLGDALAGPQGAPRRSSWLTGGAPGSPLPSPPPPGDDLCSDLEEAPEAELSHAPAEGLDLVPPAPGGLTTARVAQSIWRPW